MSRRESNKVCLGFLLLHSRVAETDTHHGGFSFNASCVLVGLSDEPLPRQSSQAQAAEDILDKYRNIKRISPSDGATAGASYDSTAGQEQTPRHCLAHTLAGDPLSNLSVVVCVNRSLC